MKELEIKVSLLIDGKEIAKRTTGNWEESEMNLQSLKDWWQKEGNKYESGESFDEERQAEASL